MTKELSAEKVMTTKEVASVLGVDVKTIQRTAEKLFDIDVVKSIATKGRPTKVYNEAQVTAIKLELQNHSKVNALTPKTLLEKQLIIQQAMNIQQEIIADLQSTVEEQKVKIKELTPLAEGYKLTMASEGTYAMADATKILKLPYGNKTLFKKLRAMEILCLNNSPKQEFVNNGCFIEVTKPIQMGREVVNKTITRVTPKGLNYIAKRLGLLSS